MQCEVLEVSCRRRISRCSVPAIVYKGLSSARLSSIIFHAVKRATHPICDDPYKLLFIDLFTDIMN